MSTSHHTDVIVIGAGWAGILSTKYMLEEGLSVVTLEKRDGLGGVWLYTDDPKEKTVMKSTRTTSSATVSEMSDYPMTEEMGEFPHHWQVLHYLQSYAQKYGLMEHIHFNANVEGVIKEGDQWKVTTVVNDESTVVYTSRFLVVCSGQRLPEDTPRKTAFANYTGTLYHSIEIKEPIPEHKGCRLLIFGGGETAADVCTDWYNHSSTVHWSAPRGQHFFRRYSKVLPWKTPQALDKASSWLLLQITPFHYSKPGLAWMCKWTTNGSLLAYQGHGLPEWKNDTPFMHRFINKNGHVLDIIDYKKVIPKGQVTSVSEKRVTFIDGTSQEFDVIILCSGYTESFPFLPEKNRPQNFSLLYKSIVDNEDPTLSFVGFIRPVIGSMFGIIEMQAMIASRLNSGRLQLISKEERLRVTQNDYKFWAEYFKDITCKDKFVEALLYINDLGRLSGVYPNRWALFRRNPYHWYVSIVAPFNPSLFRLNDPNHVDQSIATLEKHRRTTTSPLHLVLIGFFRLIWFDWWLERLGDIKYKIQTSRWWPRIRNTRFIQCIDWFWCLPKKALFDNRTTLPETHNKKTV